MSSNQIINLRNFNAEKLLSESGKKLSILCQNRKSGKYGILRLLKSNNLACSNYDFISSIFDKLVLEVYEQNDAHYMAKVLMPEFNEYLRCVFIWTVDEYYIKLMEHKPDYYWETPDDYREYIEKHMSQAPSCKWIRNIIKGKSEKELVLLRDNHLKTGFVLVKNEFGDESYSKKPSYCAFVIRQDLKSIRDLTGKEIPLLSKIMVKCKDVLSKKLKVPKAHIAAYFHYHPTFWHLHVHFKYKINQKMPFIALKRAIFLLKENSNHFKNAELWTLCKIPDLSIVKREREDGETQWLDSKFGKLSSPAETKQFLLETARLKGRLLNNSQKMYKKSRGERMTYSYKEYGASTSNHCRNEEKYIEERVICPNINSQIFSYWLRFLNPFKFLMDAADFFSMETVSLPRFLVSFFMFSIGCLVLYMSTGLD